MSRLPGSLVRVGKLDIQFNLTFLSNWISCSSNIAIMSRCFTILLFVHCNFLFRWFMLLNTSAKYANFWIDSWFKNACLNIFKLLFSKNWISGLTYFLLITSWPPYSKAWFYGLHPFPHILFWTSLNWGHFFLNVVNNFYTCF